MPFTTNDLIKLRDFLKGEFATNDRLDEKIDNLERSLREEINELKDGQVQILKELATEYKIRGHQIERNTQDIKAIQEHLKLS